MGTVPLDSHEENCQFPSSRWHGKGDRQHCHILEKRQRKKLYKCLFDTNSLLQFLQAE